MKVYEQIKLCSTYHDIAAFASGANSDSFFLCLENLFY